MTKLVSVGMPVYNEEKFIEEALESILNQDYRNIELIISDNASTDRTTEICRRYSQNDSRIRYYLQDKTTDSTANFNHVAALAQGSFFMWASGHDTRDPTFISRCVAMLERSNTIVLSYSDANWIDTNGNITGTERTDIDTIGLDKIQRIQKVLWNLGYAYPIYGLFRKESLNAALPYKKILAPDVLLLHELSLIGEFARIKEPLFNIRKLSDYGDWQAYFKKSLNVTYQKKRALGLFLEFIEKNYTVSMKYARSPAEKLILGKIFLIDTVIKYHWMLLGLLTWRERENK